MASDGARLDSEYLAAFGRCDLSGCGTGTPLRVTFDGDPDLVAFARLQRDPFAWLRRNGYEAIATTHNPHDFTDGAGI